jgi:hypothetical protein
MTRDEQRSPITNPKVPMRPRIVTMPTIEGWAETLLQQHGCTVTRHMYHLTITFPEGTLMQEVWPRTLQMRYDLFLPDGAVLMRQQLDQDFSMLLFPESAVPQAVREEREAQQARKHHVMQDNPSEIARFRRQHALEEEAARRGFSDFAAVASHRSINARMDRAGERILRCIDAGKFEEAQALMELPDWGDGQEMPDVTL